MQILIIEDEVRAANQLTSLLSKSLDDYDLLEIIDTVEDAVEWFAENISPDLVFMDIQLADGLSFEIFQKVKVDAPIIFTTAFDQYAIQAFKVNSIDYLLKPIQHEDLNFALDKFKDSRKQMTVETSLIEDLMSSLKPKSYREGILVKEGQAFFQLKTQEILYFYAENGLSFCVSEKGRNIIDETMDQIFSNLDPNQFFRINRGQIISKKAILKMESYFNHRMKLSLAHARGNEFIVSRAKTSEFKKWLNT